MSNHSLIEEWRPVNGYPAYRVSNFGRVQSRLVKGSNYYRFSKEYKDIKPCISKKIGYPMVSLSNGYTVTKVYVHDLVLTHFVGPRPEGMQACHYPDRNKLNCRIDNLRWGTRKENESHKIDHGVTNRGSRNGSSKLVESDVLEIVELHSSGMSYIDIANQFNVDRHSINYIVIGRTWSHLTGIQYQRKR